MDQRVLELTEFSFVWGPLELPEPAYSFADEWVSKIYTPREVATAILAVPGVRQSHPPLPDWNAWAARWESEARYINFEMIACEPHPALQGRPDGPIMWGGSPIEARCSVADMLAVWRRIRERCPGVWLHDTDCRLYSPESFAVAFAG